MAMPDLNLATDYLQTVTPFDSLGSNELHWLAARLEVAYYPRQQEIFSSDPPPGLGIIRKGAVRLLDDDSHFLERRSEGELFGHQIHFHGGLKDYRVEAEEDCLVWHLSQADFEALCAANPPLADYFDSQLKRRINRAIPVSAAATRVRELLRYEPVAIASDASVGEAARAMSDAGVSSILVMRGDELAGIVTDKDLRDRVLAEGLDGKQAIGTVMTAAPLSLGAEANVNEALLAMMRRNYHHLPIIENGKPIGVITAGDILRAQSEHPLRFVREIYKRRSLEGLQRLSRRLPLLFAHMVRMEWAIEHIGRTVTHITDAFTVRLIQFAQAEYGPPPVPFAWAAFGSQAREEQTARTDQDNGLILERDANEEETAWFARMAEFVCRGLDSLGYVYCPGEVMAMNPQWRVSLNRWKRHFDGWIDEPEPKSVMHSSIFFDMRCIFGQQPLVDQLLEYAVGRAQQNRIFRRFMAANVLGHRPPIGFFRRFVQEHDGSHSEGLNLKHRGIVPITDLVRMRALEGGIRVPNTFERLRRAVELEVMNADDAKSLADALELISRIRLDHHARQLHAGEKPTNFVPPDELSPLMRRNLKAAFLLVQQAQTALQLRYQVH